MHALLLCTQVLYANYIIHVKKDPRSARTQLQVAGKNEPDIFARYSIFRALVRIAAAAAAVQPGTLRMPGRCVVDVKHA